MHFSELNIILQCAVFSAIQVQNKVFYRKISKGTRDNTSNLFWNTVAFQYLPLKEKKIQAQIKNSLFSPYFHSVAVWSYVSKHNSNIKTVIERAAKVSQVILGKKEGYVIDNLAQGPCTEM